jgi:hypothetical protein
LRMPIARRDAAHRHAGTGQQGMQQHVAGAGGAAVPTGERVEPGPASAGPGLHGAGDARVGEVGLGVQVRPSGLRVVAVPLPQRGLQLAQCGGVNGAMEALRCAPRSLSRRR